mgnify:CR=1 FL=1
MHAKLLTFNKYAVDALQILFLYLPRSEQQGAGGENIRITALGYMIHLNHFARFENYLWQPDNRQQSTVAVIW